MFHNQAEGTADESFMMKLLQDKSINREAMRDAITTMINGEYCD